MTALAVLVHLGLGLLVLLQGHDDFRARLLWILFLAIGFELALPSGLLGGPQAAAVVGFVFWLLTGLQFAVEMHLASVIPQPQRWFEGRRWPLALFLSRPRTARSTRRNEPAGTGWPWTSLAGRFASR